MPCRDARDDFRCEHEYDAYLQGRKRDDKLSGLQARCDELSGLLCSFLQSFLEEGKVPEKVRVWGVSHCLHDKKDNRSWDVMVSSKLHHLAGNISLIKYEED